MEKLRADLNQWYQNHSGGSGPWPHHFLERAAGKGRHQCVPHATGLDTDQDPLQRNGVARNGASLAPFRANGALSSHISEGLRTQPRIGAHLWFPTFPPFLETQKLMQNVELLENRLAGVITLPYPPIANMGLLSFCVGVPLHFVPIVVYFIAVMLEGISSAIEGTTRMQTIWIQFGY